ncbi:zinc-finger double-stranded RNA-binding domain-containing protein [Hirsutella rhossiliensis]|uniref:Zinc-finger double-stranded RNA-binding domain-containing protein n=1 Tax=Hirsutella rhossiliensis TaxID=111463 RepID=A0A9P8SFJ3_9HYPO|nr:zinc-finger double-stranded RNA-binding domain-containing protein [Hirsutella rhossiliensis]KAH0960094.1 zinc-finger double-stranded RNA-binding domain-containing protein [Hirsutella rhossiliensis]
MGVGNKRTITKTRRKTRDVDQIKADLLSTRHLSQFKDTKAAEDLPGLGRNYCIECAKWFDTESTLNAHRHGKPHKRRVKQLREEPDPDPRTVPGGSVNPRTNNAEEEGGGVAAVDVNMAT